MSDARFDRGIDSPRGYMGEDASTTGWITGGVIAVLLVFGVLVYTVSTELTPTASNPPSETTGQSTQAPAAPETTGKVQPRNSPDPNPLPGEEPRPIPR